LPIWLWTLPNCNRITVVRNLCRTLMKMGQEQDKIGCNLTASGRAALGCAKVGISEEIELF
jgi:hypothetical protein